MIIVSFTLQQAYAAWKFLKQQPVKCLLVLLKLRVPRLMPKLLSAIVGGAEAARRHAGHVLGRHDALLQRPA